MNATTTPVFRPVSQEAVDAYNAGIKKRLEKEAADFVVYMKGKEEERQRLMTEARQRRMREFYGTAATPSSSPPSHPASEPSPLKQSSTPPAAQQPQVAACPKNPHLDLLKTFEHWPVADDFVKFAPHQPFIIHLTHHVLAMIVLHKLIAQNRDNPVLVTHLEDAAVSFFVILGKYSSAMDDEPGDFFHDILTSVEDLIGRSTGVPIKLEPIFMDFHVLKSKKHPM